MARRIFAGVGACALMLTLGIAGSAEATVAGDNYSVLVQNMGGTGQGGVAGIGAPFPGGVLFDPPGTPQSNFIPGQAQFSPGTITIDQFTVPLGPGVVSPNNAHYVEFIFGSGVAGSLNAFHDGGPGNPGFAFIVDNLDCPGKECGVVQDPFATGVNVSLFYYFTASGAPTAMSPGLGLPVLFPLNLFGAAGPAQGIPPALLGLPVPGTDDPVGFTLSLGPTNSWGNFLTVTNSLPDIFSIDEIHIGLFVEEVPEPSTSMLLGLGLGALALVRRRH